MAHAHELSKEIQAFCQENSCATSKEVRAKFPNAKAHQISYARTQAKGKKGTGKVTRTTRVGPMPSPPPKRRMPDPCSQPHFSGPLKDTETVFDRLMAIEERKTGMDITFSTADVIRLLQLANDEAQGLLQQQ